MKSSHFHLFFHSNNEKWRSRRRLITPSFHDTQLLHNYVLIFNEQSSILASRLENFAKQDDKTHDLYLCISACTLDIIAGQLKYIFQVVKYLFDRVLYNSFRSSNRYTCKCSTWWSAE